MRLLRDLGFDLHKFLFFKSIKRDSSGTSKLPEKRFRSQLVDGDAVFVRGLLDLDQLSDQQLRHLAILADAVFQSYDLAICLLEKLVDREQIPSDTVST